MKNERVTLPIYNLGCGGGGSLTIERALTRAPGVAQAYVNPATEMAYVVYDPAIAQPDELVAAVARAGFGPPISVTRGENAAPQHARPALDARRLARPPRHFIVLSRALAVLLLCLDVTHIGTLDMTRQEEGRHTGEAVARATADSLLALRAWRLEDPVPALPMHKLLQTVSA